MNSNKPLKRHQWAQWPFFTPTPLWWFQNSDRNIISVNLKIPLHNFEHILRNTSIKEKKMRRFSGAKLKITFRFIVKRSCFKVEQTPLKLVFVSEWLSSSALRGTGGTVCSHTEGVNIARSDWRCNGVLKVTPVCRLRSVIKTDLRSVVRVWRGSPQEQFSQPVTLTKCECLGVRACECETSKWE